jgi:acetyl esterase/lipase
VRAGTVPLAVGLAGAAAVCGAYRPLLTRWPVSVGGAVLSGLASEVPMLVAGAGAVGLAGALRSRPGPVRALGLALNLVTLAGTAGLSGDARRSAAVLDAALGEAGVPVEGPSGGGRPPGVLPVPLARHRYRRVADVSYSEHGPFGTLDVWHRADLPLDGAAPVLLQVHGGAWEMGDKLGQAEPLLGYLAERGWVCVTVNYRLAPASRWPDMIVDVKRAIAWTREHIGGHGGDPGFIAVTGGSAGGHLAALAALSANDPAYQPGFEQVDTTLAAAVPMYGVHDFTRDRQGLWALLEGRIIGTSYAADGHTWRQASPLLRVRPDSPPFLVVHGSTDAIVGIEQSRRLAGALRSHGVRAGYAELPHAQHGFDTMATARTAFTVRAVHRFLADAHRRAVTARAGETGRSAVRSAR